MDLRLQIGYHEPMTERPGYDHQIARELGVRTSQVAAPIELVEGGNTRPLIASYSKEATGGLAEEQLRQIIALLKSLRGVDERRQTIIAAIDELGKLTPELRAQLLAATTMTALEDL